MSAVAADPGPDVQQVLSDINQWTRRLEAQVIELRRAIRREEDRRGSDDGADGGG